MITQPRAATLSAWHDALPVLWGRMASLREIEFRDASPLVELLTAPDVARFISPPPDTCDAFERYIAWARDERRNGRYVCFAVVPHGMETAVGLFHVRRLDLGFHTAEWGFALGSAFWGTGVFAQSAALVLDFAFGVIGLTRLEARVAMPNGRAHGALRKIGAIQEAVLRRSFASGDHCLDQAMWSIVDADRNDGPALEMPRIYVH